MQQGPIVEVEYFELPELPGRAMFRCEPLKANLAVASCADMWRQAAQRGAPERLDRCRNCHLGAKHAGVRDASLSPLHGAMVCGRCHTGTTRLIHGHLCPSCYNRQLEYLKGRNAKGNAPKYHPVLWRIAIRYMAGGRIKTLCRPHVVSSEELVIAALRDEAKQVTFGPTARKPAGMPQLELFA